MAIKFHPNINSLATQAFIYGPLNQTSGVSTNQNISAGVWIYSGAQPTAETVSSNWTSYNGSGAGGSNLLIIFAGPTLNKNGANNYIEATAFPAQTTARSTGTATWAIIWPGAYGSNYVGASLMSYNFVVVPVSTLGGNGVVKLNSVNITSGTQYALQEVSISISQVG